MMPFGHAVVLEAAGSGKTTIAILRAMHLADPETDHSGRKPLLTYSPTRGSVRKSLRHS